MEFLSTYFNLIPVSLAQGGVYAFVALGVMIPFRLLSPAGPDCRGQLFH